MKGISIAVSTTCAVSLLCATLAFGADVNGKRHQPLDEPKLAVPTYQEPAKAAVPYGFYLGVEGGGQFTNIDIQGGGVHFDGIGADGLIGGAVAGFDTGFGRIKGGACVAGGFSDVNSIVELGGYEAELTLDHYLQVCGRIGLVTDGGTFIFGKLGYEWQKWTLGDNAGSGDIDVDSQWFVIGGGVETPIKDGVSFRLSLDYLMLNDVDAGADADNAALNSALEDTEAFRGLVGVVYHFGSVR